MFTLLYSRHDTIVDRIGDAWAGIEQWILIIIIAVLAIIFLRAWICGAFNHKDDPENN